MTFTVKRAALITVLLLTTVGTSSAAVRLAGITPTATLKREVVDFNAGAWHDYWNLMSARFHGSCLYATFVARNEQARNIAGRASVKVLSSRVSGSHAYLTYKTMGTKIQPIITKNDMFVRVGGRWYDELDSATRC